jgi:phosphate transport system permease protein
VKRVGQKYLWRKVLDIGVRAACLLATLAAAVPLFMILWLLASKGAAGLSWDFFTKLPTPVGETGGGMTNAIVGTLLVAGIAGAIGIPLGIMAGIYLAEFGNNRFASVVRFSADVMAGVPSIVVGMFAYTLLVTSMKRFSALAGGVALAVLMLPTVARTTEEMLKLVPDTLREAALALGVPKWRAIPKVVLRTALPGVATGVMLAVARAMGETAPLLFTAFNNRFWSDGIDQPTSTLTVQVFTYAISPYEDWHRQAWAAALVLVSIVLVLDFAARMFVRHRTHA